MLDLFTKDSHHRNITVLYLKQDLFPPGKFAKTINRNAHYIIAVKNPRDKTGKRNILMQMYPDRWKTILDLYNEITLRPFGYLMLDVHPASDDRYCLWSHLTKAEGTAQVHTKVTNVPSSVVRKRPSTRTRSLTATKRRRQPARFIRMNGPLHTIPSRGGFRHLDTPSVNLGHPCPPHDFVNFSVTAHGNTQAYQSINFSVGEFFARSARLDELLATLAGKLNSNESFNPQRGFQVDIFIVSMPNPGSGRGKKRCGWTMPGH